MSGRLRGPGTAGCVPKGSVVLGGLLLAVWGLGKSVPGYGARPRTSAPERFGTVPFSVEANRFEVLRPERVYRAVGDVVVRRAGTVLYADRVEFDARDGTAVAEGRVVAVEGRAVLSCRRATLALPGLRGEILRGALRIKRGIRPEVLARTPTTAWSVARDRAVIGAERLERTGPRRYDAHGVSLTTCDCGEDGASSWSIRASRASVSLDSGVWLYWPVFSIKNVPVFALPVFYVPLGDRRSGLLTPRVGVRPNVTGFGVRQPLYLVLGDSADLTLEPGYYTARGPFADLEFRYAPDRSTTGTWKASYIADLGPPDRVQDNLVSRFAVAGRHATRLEPVRVVADVNLAGDPAYVSDLADDFLKRQAEFTRSRVTASSELGGVRLSAQAHLLQDVREETYRVAGVPLREVSLFSGSSPGPGDVRYRLAEVRLDAPLAPMFPARASPGDASVRGSVRGPVGGARLTAAAYAAPRASVARFVRVDLRPEVRWPFRFGPFGFEVYGFGRATAWAGRDAEETTTASRVTGGLGVSGFAHLSRRYASVVHVLRPSLEYRIIPGVSRSADVERFDTGDEIDLLFARNQVLGRLETAFLGPRDLARRGGLTLTLGRDFGGLREPGAGWSELVVEGDVAARIGSVQFDLRGLVAVDVRSPRIAEAGGTLSLGWGPGSIRLAWLRLADRVPRYPLLAPEELVPSRSRPATDYIPLQTFVDLSPEDQQGVRPWSKLDALSVAVSARPVAPLTVGAAAVLTFQDREVLARVYGDGGQRSFVRELRGAVRWDAPCRCWSAFLSVATARDQSLAFRLGVELSQLGSVVE